MDKVEFMKRIEVVEIGESDVLVLETERKLSREACAQLKDSVKRAIGDAKVLVLSDGFRLAIAPKATGE